MSMTEPTDVLPAANDCPPEVAEKNAKALARIEASRLGDRVKRSLRHIGSGMSYREAAAAEGYASWSDVWRYGNRFGLIDLTTGRLIGGCRRIARLSNDELEERLLNDPAEISTRDLVIANGVALDKLAKRERWGQEPKEGAGALDVLERLADRVVRGDLELELRVSRPDAAERAIDVTPSD